MIEIEYTHHGPIVAHKDGKAYSMAIPYAEEIGLTDQIYQMMMARNLDEMKRALTGLQLMAQNIMVGTVQGDIYYVRNGRVPIRAKGVDSSKPVAGNTSATEWQGLHTLRDLGSNHEPAARVYAQLQCHSVCDDERQPAHARQIRRTTLISTTRLKRCRAISERR